MKAKDLLAELEEFQERLTQHQELWGRSLDQPIPDYPVRNNEELREQSRWMSRKVGALRPYILRFDDSWIMHHPATGTRWNALDAAVGLDAVAQAKGPAIRSTIQKLDQIIGRLQTLEPEDEIPEDVNQPVKPGIGVDYLILGYLGHLHEYISRGCMQLFIDGHYSQAIEEASKAVFQYIREKTGLTGDGAPLAEAAFSLKSPTLAFSDLSSDTKRNEQLGFMEMLKGFAKGVRNPLAHTHGQKEEAQKAFEYLVLASLLCRRIDDASPQVDSDDA